jgi:hypothetical protein
MFQGSGVAGRMAHWMRDTVDCQVLYLFIYLFMYVSMSVSMDEWMDGSGVYGVVYIIHRLIRFKAALTVALGRGILLTRRATEYLFTLCMGYICQGMFALGVKRGFL